MAAITTIVAAAALTVAAGSAYVAYEEKKDAQRNAKKAAAEQRKIQNEQRAQNAQQAASERRNQIREERVRRARIMQAAENSGTTDSSGMAGALSGMSAQLGSNLGINAGRQAAAGRISIFAQNAADYQLGAQKALYNAENAQTLGSVAGSIFTSAGGFGAFNSTQAATPTYNTGGVNLSGSFNPSN